MSKLKIKLISFFEGFMIMGLELIGAKQLSIYFGNTIHVWTTMLGITMFSLALGYFLGAYLSKKNPEKRITLLLIILSGSLAIMLIYIKNMTDFIDFDNLISSLILNSILLLSLPLILTSTLSPLLIEIHTERTKNSGESAGYIFSIATLAGIVSAYFFGFFIIPSFGLKLPILIMSIFVMVFSISLMKFKYNKIIYTVAAFFILISFKSLQEVNKTNYVLKHQSEGLLGELKVVDFYHYDAQQVFRKLAINNINQSEIMPNDYAQSAWTYPHIFALFSTMKPQASNALLIGLGGGSVAKELLRQKIKFDAVELDERIPELAEEYFFLKKKDYNLIVDDGRHYLNTSDKKYDLVLFDIASGEVQPNHLYSIEALQSLKKILNKNALVLINFQGSATNDEKGIGFRTLYKTFKNQKFNIKYWSEKRSEISNDIIFLLSLENLDQFKLDISKLEKCCLLKSYVQIAIKKPFNNFVPNLLDVSILTDERPFLENINRTITTYWRKNMELQ